MRLVLDTNILVAALISPHAPPASLYQAWRSGRYELITSTGQLEELRRVFAYPKLQRYVKPGEAQELINGLAIYADCITQWEPVAHSPDPDDNPILAAAIAAKADYIVSGDHAGMLALRVVEGIAIVTARQMVNILDGIQSM